MKEKKNKRVGTTALLVIIFLAGLSLLLYPTISNYWNKLHQTYAIGDYTQKVEEIEGEKNAELWEEAHKYNEELLNRTNPYVLPEKMLSRYEEVLDVSGTGIMGYVEIPKIDCTLPIYHGTDEAVLQVAIGHLEWTSLPVGGPGTHSAISGHRGLPSAELMTHIDRLEPGDRFYIHVLNEILEYRVCDIFVVLPEDTSKLRIEAGKDYMTLVTCTPYGINSHRLLVRGERVSGEQSSSGSIQYINNEIEEVSLMYVLPVILVIIVLAAFLWIWLQDQRVVYRRKIRRYRRSRRKMQEGGEQIWANESEDN